jgi:exodeoxyribonuclease-5
LLKFYFKNMINQYLEEKIRSHFSFQPTPQQAELIGALSEFVASSDADSVFLLKGCAGTGKTSVVSALIQMLGELRMPVVLLAPTGRAAKVLSSYSGRPAFTIHRCIYREKVGGELYGDFSLNVNRNRGAIFVVDEASMISNGGMDSNFGSGHLLSDLLSFVYCGDGSRIIFVGDVAQLPPVGSELSPALDRVELEGSGLKVSECFLTEVVRQSQQSGILYNATQLRQLMEGYDGSLPAIATEGFHDVHLISGAELVEEIASAYSHYGMDDVTIISRSNKRVGIINNGVRAQVLGREEELTQGDMLMVVKNNYFWAKGVEHLDFIANGDVAEVRRVRHQMDMYGFRFADVTLRFPDYGDVEIDVKILLDGLQSPAPSLSYEENTRLYQAVEADYMDITNKRDRFRKMREDAYLNALQVKFAYAVTCHKAQGGQWSCVFLDKGFVPPEQMNVDFLRWLYTAFTRATQSIYLINWEPEEH